MDGLKVNGIVLKAETSGEQDKKLTLLIREMGCLTVTARGALSVKSKLRAVTEPFCCASFELSRNKKWFYVKEAQLLESYYCLRTDILKLAAGSFMLEAAKELALDFDENGADNASLAENSLLVSLLLRGLKALELDLAAPDFAIGAFLWRFFAESGYLLDPEHHGAYPFLYAEERTEELLDLIYRVQAAPEKLVFSIECPQAQARLLRDTAVRLLQYQSGREYDSIKFLYTLD